MHGAVFGAQPLSYGAEAEAAALSFIGDALSACADGLAPMPRAGDLSLDLVAAAWRGLLDRRAPARLEALVAAMAPAYALLLAPGLLPHATAAQAHAAALALHRAALRSALADGWVPPLGGRGGAPEGGAPGGGASGGGTPEGVPPPPPPPGGRAPRAARPARC